MSAINLLYFLRPAHFPIFAVMLYFLGAFFIVLLGKNRILRNCIAFLSTGLALTMMILLIKPIMLDGATVAYWMGNRTPAGGYAIGIALEVDALGLFFGLLIATAVFVSCLYSFS